MSTLTPFSRAWKSQNNSSYVYVDSFAGDDFRGLGTQEFPFQTLNKAIEWAYVNNKTYIVARGYFSENITNGRSKYILADAFGDLIYDGQFIYHLINVSFYSNITEGIILLRASTNTSFSYINLEYSMLIYAINALSATSYCVFKGFKNKELLSLSICSYSFSNCSFIDYPSNQRGSSSTNFYYNIYDNCRIYLDTNQSYTQTYNTCLFRLNCTFWKRKADNSGDERIDSDTMTPEEKIAVITDWLNNGTEASGYKKVSLNNCKFTNNRIFNCPDNEETGTNYDFSLIYGTSDAQPACFMKHGKHIGPLPPAIKIEFKRTEDLTTSPFEIEVKDTDNLEIVNGGIIPTANFNGAVLYSKPMPLPFGTQFNGFNISLFPDTTGFFINGRTDNIDLSENNRIVITDGTSLESGKCYLVKADIESAAVYKGVAYLNNTVLMADDSTSQCTKSGSGNVYLYPMLHPSIWSNVQCKVCESGVLPADFITNDNSYPWIYASLLSRPQDPTDPTKYTGLRCLRVGNVANGAIDIGSDGKILTNAHPEFYSSENINRIKFPINAAWVMLRITILSINPDYD